MLAVFCVARDVLVDELMGHVAVDAFDRDPRVVSLRGTKHDKTSEAKKLEKLHHESFSMMTGRSSEQN